MNMTHTIYEEIMLEDPPLPEAQSELNQRLIWRHHVHKIEERFMRTKNAIYPQINHKRTVTLKRKLMLYTSVLSPVLTYTVVA